MESRQQGGGAGFRRGDGAGTAAAPSTRVLPRVCAPQTRLMHHQDAECILRRYQSQPLRRNNHRPRVKGLFGTGFRDEAQARAPASPVRFPKLSPVRLHTPFSPTAAVSRSVSPQSPCIETSPLCAHQEAGPAGGGQDGDWRPRCRAVSHLASSMSFLPLPLWWQSNSYTSFKAWFKPRLLHEPSCRPPPGQDGEGALALGPHPIFGLHY